MAQQTPIFVALPTSNTGAGTLLPSLFPNIDKVLLLAIGWHAFKLAHLFKLDTCIKEKPATSFLDFENGAIIHKEWEPSIKEYPLFISLYSPLVVYFNILQIHVTSSGNLPVIHQVIFGCSKYLCSLYDLYIEYDWTALLNYHFAFHAKHLQEMLRGDYSQWSEIDWALQTRFLIAHAFPHPSKDRTASPCPAADVSKQLCNDFNYHHCTWAKCPHIHKCKGCDSPNHGMSACSSKQT